MSDYDWQGDVCDRLVLLRAAVGLIVLVLERGCRRFHAFFTRHIYIVVIHGTWPLDE